MSDGSTTRDLVELVRGAVAAANSPDFDAMVSVYAVNDQQARLAGSSGVVHLLDAYSLERTWGGLPIGTGGAAGGVA
jgi:hypothetical protein